MSDLAHEILQFISLNCYKNNRCQYNYSKDLHVKGDELKAIKELSNNGYIIIHTHALGFVDCELL